uniref:PA domain-containing protein n=1 Tax=Arion vulgaris TaxID=1028688 RepID=A0A0B7AK20_9EUPU
MFRQFEMYPKNIKTLLLVLAILYSLLFTTASTASGGYGLLEARSTGKTRTDNRLTVCIVYNSKHQTLPANVENATFHHLVDLSHVEGCTAEDFSNPAISLENSTVAVMRGNCTFTQKAYMIEAANGATALVVDFKNVTHSSYPEENRTQYNFNITLATITFEDYIAVLNLSESIQVAMYSPSNPAWDPNMILIIILSTLIVVVGAAWIAYDERQLSKVSRRKTSKSCDTEQNDEDKNSAKDDELEFSVLTILIWFVLICGIILLLYFFYDYMVYFFIAVFCIVGSYSLYKCLLPLWSMVLPINYGIPINRLPCIRQKVKLRSFLLLMPCLTISIFWAIQRHATYAWILQDLLGATFCINIIHTLRLPNLKVIAILLILLLVYDVFFVFITPLFTSDGKSIMESVATGGRSNSKESLPMVFLLPILFDSPIRQCMGHNFSLLGFGDVIIPGLLVAYNAAFDMKSGNRMVYFICSSVGYFVGMIICITSLVYMKSGQPALLYLVPGTLFTTLIMAAVRKEFRALFWGQHKQQPKADDSIKPVPDESEEENFGTSIIEEEQKNLMDSS